jgi:hypothetical protein
MRPGSCSDGVLATNSTWQWNLNQSQAKPTKTSAGATATLLQQQGIQRITIQRHFTVKEQPKIGHIQEFKTLRYRDQLLQVGILQEVKLKSQIAAQNSLERKFRQLSKQWENETEMLSDLSQKVIHPAYQRIIGMGQDAIPLLLNELSKRPNHWFWALRSITGTNPVKPEHRGRIKLMAQDWLCWGRDHGYEC